jgi:hypothetical protein
VQPLVQRPADDGKGNQQRDQQQFQEIHRQHDGDIAHRGSHNFPDADFLLPPLGGKSRQTEQAEAANQNGESGKIPRQNTDPAFGSIERLVVFVEELVVENKSLVIGFEGALNFRNRLFFSTP